MRTLLLCLLAMLCTTALHAQTPVQVRLADPNDSQPAEPSTEKISLNFLTAVKENAIGEKTQAAEIFGAIATVTQDRHTASLYYLAKMAMDEQDFAKAEHYVRRALASDNDNTLYLSLLCDSYLDRNLFAKADSVVGQLLAIDSTDQAIERLRVYTTFQLGNKALTLELADKYDKKYGFDRLIFECRKDILIGQRKFDELMTTLDRALTSGDEPELLVFKGQLLATMGRDSAALAAYQDAIKRAPSAGSYAALADYWRIKGDTTQYVNAVVPLLRDPVVKPEGKITLVTELFKMNVKPNSANARTLVDTLIAYDTSLTIKTFEIDLTLYSGDLERGCELLERVYTLQTPPTQKTLETMARVYFQLKSNSARLFDLLTEGITRYPENMIFASIGVYAFDEPESRKIALEFCDLAVKTASTDSLRSQAYTLRGDFYNKHNKLSKAAADYQKAVELNPHNATAYNNYAYALAVAGKQLDEALALSNRAVDMEPENFTFLDTKAWVLFRSGRFAEAKTFIIRAVNLTKTPPVDILLHAGDIYNALNDLTTARYYWNWAAKEGATPEQMGDRLPRTDEGK